MQLITSKDNEKVKHIRKLKDKKYREQTGQYIIEGIKLLDEAIKEKVDLDTIVICEDKLTDTDVDKKILYEIAKYNCIYVSQNVFNLMTDVVNPQGILGIANKNSEKSEINYKEDILVVLDNIQDPGNLGTIIRTVDSIGLKQLIISKNSCDAYSPKVVRSTMGALFRVKLIESENLVKTLFEIKKHKFKIMSTSLEAQNSIYSTEFLKKAIVIGNEANGISKEILEISDEKVKIPMLRENRKFKCFCCYRYNII